MYSDTTKQIFFKILGRHHPRESGVAELVKRVESECIVGGEEGAYLNSIPLSTRRTWVARFLLLHEQGRQREAACLTPLKHAKRGPKPVFTPEVRTCLCMLMCADETTPH